MTSNFEIDIRHGDAYEELQALDDESVQLTVTSPPYNIGIDYGEEYDDRQPLSEWEDLMRNVFEELFRVTKPDGKVAVNVGYSYGSTDIDGRYFRIPLNQYIMEIAREVGFDMFDEYVWVKNSFASHGGGALFGSYPYPTNFMANQQHEYVLIFRKWVSDSYHRSRDLPPKGTDKREDSALSKEDWREYTQSVWELEPASNEAVSVEHDAMFPVELPERLIRLYSFVGDTVLDPFSGTGTTGVAAKQWERKFIGVERNEEYVDAAKERLDGSFQSKLGQELSGGESQSDEDGQTQRTLGDGEQADD